MSEERPSYKQHLPPQYQPKERGGVPSAETSSTTELGTRFRDKVKKRIQKELTPYNISLLSAAVIGFGLAARGYQTGDKNELVAGAIAYGAGSVSYLLDKMEARKRSEIFWSRVQSKFSSHRHNGSPPISGKR